MIAVAGALGSIRAPAVLAAADGLSLVSKATYTLDPPAGAVHVSVDVTATNLKPDSTSGRVVTHYFYTRARLAILPEATRIRATSAGHTLMSTTARNQRFSAVDVRFRSDLYYKQSAVFRVTFDLPGDKPRGKSAVRVGSAFATFEAWAYGDRGDVRVVIPAGFRAETSGSDVHRSTSGNATVLTAQAIADVPAWYVWVNADREAALTSDRLDFAGGEHVLVRAWPEDAIWRKQVTALLHDGLPELDRLIGLDWPVDGNLSVFEVHTPLLEGYAGVFIADRARIEISEDLDDLTILHEASHAWFNHDLFVGRWISEGLADTYASRALDTLAAGDWAPEPVLPTDRAAVPLNDWQAPGRIADDQTDAREQYGYNASWTVISSLLDEIGEERMRQVFAAASDHSIAYRAGAAGAGQANAEADDRPTDWRRFLDLLDEVGGSRTADATIRRWVANAGDGPLLDRRATARDAYRRLIGQSDGWLVPLFIRQPMAVWDFDQAEARIRDGVAILQARDEIARLISPLGAVPSAALRTTYETSAGSLGAARGQADQELENARVLSAAASAVAAPRDLFDDLGLLGSSPEEQLTAAARAFSTGGSEAARRAQAISSLMAGAGDAGRTRLAVGAATGGAMIIIGGGAAFAVRRRRREPASVAVEAAAFPVGADVSPVGAVVPVVEPGGSYATLPDQSDMGSIPDEPPSDPSPTEPNPHRSDTT